MTSHLTVNREELSKLPYFNRAVQDNRIVPLLPCLNNDGEWELWIPGRDGLVRLRNPIPVEGDYFAKAPDKETDIYVEFLNFITKRAYWPDLASLVDGVREDIHNLAASLEKIDFFFETREQIHRDLSRFVSTEIEYIVTTCRSLFDLLQKVISKLWERVRLYDTSIQKKNSLPQSFRKMVLYDDNLQNLEEIQKRHGLPEPLADFYQQAGPFFDKLRDFRVGIAHYGVGAGPIFQTPRGFAVDTTRRPFSSFNIWKEENLLPNHLGSLRLLTAHIITESLTACKSFALIMQQTVDLPPDIAPDYKLFLRGHHVKSLLSLQTILEGEFWWE